MTNKPTLQRIGKDLWATDPPPDHARLVSYSELSTMECWLKHHYAYSIGLKPVERYAALQLGSAWDAFYNTWHGGEQPTEDLPHYAPELPAVDSELLPWQVEVALMNTINEVDLLHVAPALAAADHELRKEAVRVMGELTDKDLPLPLDFTATLQEQRTIIYGMALNYVARWGSYEPGATIGVQVRFAVPLPSENGGKSNRYYLHGVIDRLMMVGDDAWIIDAKLKMSNIDQAYCESFERDPQLALYGWALQQAGWNVKGGYIDAAAATIPRWPGLKKNPEKVLDSSGEPVMEPVPCDLCLGKESETAVFCERCGGEGIERFKSGAKKGEAKMRAKTRPGLYSGWDSSTCKPVALEALAYHQIEELQYPAELVSLGHRWSGAIEDRFHWRMDALPFTDAQLARASLAARGVAGYLDKLPPVPMPSKMRCRFCSYKDLCPSTHPADFAEGFTTREQRHEASIKQAEAVAAAVAAGDTIPI